MTSIKIRRKKLRGLGQIKLFSTEIERLMLRKYFFKYFPEKLPKFWKNFTKQNLLLQSAKLRTRKRWLNRTRKWPMNLIWKCQQRSMTWLRKRPEPRHLRPSGTFDQSVRSFQVHYFRICVSRMRRKWGQSLAGPATGIFHSGIHCTTLWRGQWRWRRRQRSKLGKGSFMRHEP